MPLPTTTIPLSKQGTPKVWFDFDFLNNVDNLNMALLVFFALQTEKIIPILLHIRNHVHRLATQFGKSVFRICHGIPQGMHLSAILCEIYYNSLDLKHFHDFRQTKKGEIFVRYCDDYLFITPEKDRAEM